MHVAAGGRIVQPWFRAEMFTRGAKVHKVDWDILTSIVMYLPLCVLLD